MNTDMLSITVCICTRDRSKDLSTALGSLAASSELGATCPIIVVDNSSDEQELRLNAEACEQYGTVAYHKIEALGLSHARNEGLALCKSDVIVFLDDDARAQPGLLDAYVEAFRALPHNVAVLGGRVDPLWEAKVPRWVLGGGAAGDSDPKTLAVPMNHDRPLVGVFSIANWGGGLRPYEKGEWVAGANMAFKTSALRDVGGFRTDLGRTTNKNVLLSGEETAVIQALTDNGRSSYYCPDARVLHRVPSDRLSQEWVIRRNTWQVVSDLLASIGTSKVDPNYELAELSKVSTELFGNETVLPSLVLDRDPDTFDARMFAVIRLVRLVLSGSLDDQAIDPQSIVIEKE